MKRFPLLIVCIPLIISATIWPVGEPDQARPIGNSWGAIQTFHPDNPYLHPGVDVMGVSTGQPVYAVADGQVKAWMSLGGNLYWRIATADTITNDSCDGWLYAHIDPIREHKVLGDWVEEGEIIGYLVNWPTQGFHHLHWARIRAAGEIWYVGNNYLWEFVDNPMIDLEPSPDTLPPIFYNTWHDQLFSFRTNNTFNYLEPDNLQGDVDIIARVHDKTGIYWEGIEDTTLEHLAPKEISYEIHGQQSSLPVRSFILDGHLQDITGLIDVIYSRDYFRCHAVFDWEQREYYFMLTNTDGDSLREYSDYDSCWHTSEFPDGDYWVVVTAVDAAGNTSVDSMQVTLNNGNPGLAEEITISHPSVKLLTPIVTKGVELSVINPVDQELLIYDVNGQRKMSVEMRGSINSQTICISDLPSGVYFLGCKSLNFKRNKFVVVR